MTNIFPPRLNIRQKVVVIFTASIVVIGLIAMLSYHSLRAIELKQHVAEVANDLREVILELRRYEKNYLLYGSREDLQENMRYTELGLKALAEIESEGRSLQIANELQRFKQELLSYHRLIQGVAAQLSEPSPSKMKRPLSMEQEEELRERGKTLVDLSQQLVKIERRRILDIITSLKTQLLGSVVLFVISGVLLSLLVSRRIIRPLNVIEQTTLRIAKGNFRPLPVLETRDETQQVVEAFNRMVAELEKRQDQLVQSKKMSSLGILTAGIAHQLNNPLNNISTSCQIIMEELEGGEPEFLKKMLRNIDQEVHRARDIVKGLLEFSRARDFSIKIMPLQEVVRRAIKLISSQVPAGVEIVEEIPPDLQLPLDPQRMQEVFLNLLMNAIQAIEEPPGEIRVTAWADEARGDAVITVADTGIGIPKELLDHVFDPFYSTKEVGVGTGLGLSIAYGIVEKHRGQIKMESTEGAGTRVIIRLPLKAEPGEERS
jgi:two-component system NtrC family sensor kinase